MIIAKHTWLAHHDLHCTKISLIYALGDLSDEKKQRKLKTAELPPLGKTLIYPLFVNSKTINNLDMVPKPKV